MSATAIVLVLISAVVHASWNFIGKRSKPMAAFFAIASFTGFLLLVPLAIAWRSILAAAPASVWLRLIPAGFFQMLYFVGLAGAYRTGDMSLAYPIARALPVMLVPAVSLIIGQGEPIPALSLLGMLAVTAGVFVVAQPTFRGFSWRSFGERWFAFALLAGIGTSGYSMVDDAALREFRAVLDPQIGSFRAPVLYAMLESLATAVSLLIASLLARGARGTAREVRAVPARAAVLSGMGIIVAYGIVLAALGFAANVSYVVAFRQVSLPIGALLAVMLLHERVSATRVVGTLVLLAGLVVIALA